jgi:hypothetical protein
MISEEDRWKIVLYVRKLKDVYVAMGKINSPATESEPKKDGN